MLQRKQVAKDKTASVGDLTRAKKDRPTEDRTVKDKGVEFAVFSARVGAGRKIAKKGFVEFTPGEAGIDNLGVNANGHSAETLRVKKADEFARITLPEGKEGGHADARKILFAIGAQVLEKDVAEGDFADALIVETAQGLFHARFIDGIPAPSGDAYFVQRQADGFGLELQEFAANAVHADAFIALGDGGQEGRRAELLLPEQRVKRHGAVFAAAPAEHNGFACVHENFRL
jgi:hypothetical protein